GREVRGHRARRVLGAHVPRVGGLVLQAGGGDRQGGLAVGQAGDEGPGGRRRAGLPEAEAQTLQVAVRVGGGRRQDDVGFGDRDAVAGAGHAGAAGRAGAVRRFVWVPVVDDLQLGRGGFELPP